MKEIKSVFFRIIFNLPLGFLFLKILGDINPQLCLNQIDMKSIFNIASLDTPLPSWFWAMIYLSLLLLAGEIISILGEGLISWLFEFPAFWNQGRIYSDNNNFEKITPCGESYITHKMLVTALSSNGGIGDFSELHFSLSRLLAGAAWLCLLILSIWTCWFIVLLVIFLIITYIIMRCRIKPNWTSFFMLLLSLLFIMILTLAKNLNFFNLMDIIYPVLVTILTVILLFAACIYRSVANVINFSADKTNS